jgi:tetratricopeptide (TPR) repeat protein
MSSIARIALLFASLLIAPCVGAQSDDYQEASKLFRSGQQAQALDRVDNFLKANPKDARGRFLKGLILTEQNKAADAIKIFTDLTGDYPELPEPYNNLAVLYASQGQYDKARAALEMAIRTHPSYATAHENLGDIYAKMASQAYDKALQLDKSNTAAQTKLELIKELFSSSARGVKPAAGKAETDAKAAPTVIAASGKPAPAQPAPPAVATPGVNPVPVAQPIKSAADPAGEVIKTVNSWAKAWSDNDVKSYLAFYAPDFQTPGGEPRNKWEAMRTKRIAKPRKIEVRVSSPEVKIVDNNHATVTFRQDYRAATLNLTSTKTLTLVKGGDRWLIQQERSTN